MSTETKKRAQIHMDDVVVRDNELEGLLEEREITREERLKANSEFNKADEEVRKKIDGMSQKPPYRCGRFVITSNTSKPKTVTFETEAKTTISIKLAGE